MMQSGNPLATSNVEQYKILILSCFNKYEKVLLLFDDIIRNLFHNIYGEGKSIYKASFFLPNPKNKHLLEEKYSNKFYSLSDIKNNLKNFVMDRIHYYSSSLLKYNFRRNVILGSIFYGNEINQTLALRETELYLEIIDLDIKSETETFDDMTEKIKGLNAFCFYPCMVGNSRKSGIRIIYLPSEDLPLSQRNKYGIFPKAEMPVNYLYLPKIHDNYNQDEGRNYHYRFVTFDSRQTNYFFLTEFFKHLSRNKFKNFEKHIRKIYIDKTLLFRYLKSFVSLFKRILDVETNKIIQEIWKYEFICKKGEFPFNLKEGFNPIEEAKSFLVTIISYFKTGFSDENKCYSEIFKSYIGLLFYEIEMHKFRDIVSVRHLMSIGGYSIFTESAIKPSIMNTTKAKSRQYVYEEVLNFFNDEYQIALPKEEIIIKKNPSKLYDFKKEDLYKKFV